MVLIPNLYYKNVQSIKIEDLKNNGIKGIAVDVDNTLIDYQKVLSKEVIEWVNSIKEAGFQICILSNSNKLDKIASVANALKLDYIMFARKPFKVGFKQILEKFNLPVENIAVIGDQVFTDVLGANRMNMVSIYVEPINKKEYWYTKWKRPIETLILKAGKKKMTSH